MRQWFAARAKPKREHFACAMLAQRGIETYLPQISTRRRSGQRSPIVEPLFPAYIFARLELAGPDWIAARSAPGVVYFLGADGVPSALPDELIAAIHDRAGGRQTSIEQAAFAKGQRVRIESGPMDGLEAVFDGHLSSSGRVRVLLEVVSRLVPVELHVELLRAAC